MKYFGYTLFMIGVVNFASFWIIAVIIGGDAVGSGPVDGRYYVSEHGRRTEVSRSVFEYSWYHARSVWVTHPLAAFGWYLVYCEVKKRKSKPAA
jgi:hypothetical protein